MISILNSSLGPLGVSRPASSGVVDPGTLGDDLAAWWKFDDGSGSTLTDSSGNGRNGTLVGSPTWGTDGPTGASLTFAGTQHVNLGTQFYLIDYPSGSISAWFQMAESPPAGRQWLWSCRRGSGDNRWYLGVDAAIGLFSALGNAAGKAVAAVPDTSWHHVVMTWQSGVATLWLDGAEAAVGSAATISASSGTINGRIASLVGGTSEFWQGSIGPMRVYSRVLNTTEIQYLWQSKIK